MQPHMACANQKTREIVSLIPQFLSHPPHVIHPHHKTLGEFFKSKKKREMKKNPKRSKNQ